MISSAIHGWIARRLPTAPTAVRNAEDQLLEAEPLPLSKIRDRSTEGNGRPHRTAVFDF